MFKYRPEPRFRAPRIWSNSELSKISPFVGGSVVNVSGWRDADKEGGTYRERFFSHADEYWITNWKADARGFQGDLPNELFLDLENALPEELVGKFDVVFNHTTLEHVFDVFKAFENMCAMSKDIVIVVVPFLQEQHGEYGDYWRFTPWGVKRLFVRNGVVPAYINFNDGKSDSIYVVGVGAKAPSSVEKLRALEDNKVDAVEQMLVGCNLLGKESAYRKLKRVVLGRIY